MDAAVREHVVCIHGIWMLGAEMGLLRRRLRLAGFSASQFHYPSLSQSPASNARALAAYVAARPEPVVHLVAHSLGGMLVVEAMQQGEMALRGRVVLLGSPVRGSQVARHTGKNRWLRWSLGKAADLLAAEHAPAWRSEASLGVIAGTHSVGLGKLLSPLDSPNDGTVAVAETEIAGAVRRNLPVTHMGLVFNPAVAEETVCFLRSGRFSE